MPCKSRGSRWRAAPSRCSRRERHAQAVVNRGKRGTWIGLVIDAHVPDPEHAKAGERVSLGSSVSGLMLGLDRPQHRWLSIVLVAMLFEMATSLAAPWPAEHRRRRPGLARCP